MSAHPDRPGMASTLIDIALVLVILAGFGLLLLIAGLVVSRGARLVAALVRRRGGCRRWPRNGGGL